MSVYDNIESILHERKMSRRQLAAAAGIPPTTLQSALSRKKNMSTDMLKKIAIALNMSEGELLVGELQNYWVDADGKEHTEPMFEEPTKVSKNNLDKFTGPVFDFLKYLGYEAADKFFDPEGVEEDTFALSKDGEMVFFTRDEFEEIIKGFEKSVAYEIYRHRIKQERQPQKPKGGNPDE